MSDSCQNTPLITKQIVHAGTKNVSFTIGTKVVFHFETRKCDDDGTLLDDSRRLGRPMELVLGKQFKLEAWESMVQMMALNEVAKFRVDKSLVGGYPFVSKTLREVGKPVKHRCCAALQNEGVGHKDLNELLTSPCDLEFTFELIKVESPEEYERESWQMNEQEKLQDVPVLREEGNTLYRKGEYEAAAKKYAQAIGHLEQLMLNEKPGDKEWLDLDEKKRPLLLNYAQCKFQQGDYYAVIEHCSAVLKTEKDNVKALFRRAKAHVRAWNPAEARVDFLRVLELDPSLSLVVHKELKLLEDLEHKKYEEDKQKFKGKMF
ncbi:AH receptor-interacting protein [Bacillus rossius redtenbacheri]|uniref:AH receptor-interacting protein n=1 Tax=Bacillus rossius redtenbacheri TaxID=93214 RepID=UPI002FDEE8E3